MTTTFWSQQMRGNGAWPEHWTPSTGARFADPILDHESRISTLESQMTEVRSDQTRLEAMLMKLRDKLSHHIGRSLMQIIRQRWLELVPILGSLGAIAYIFPEQSTRLWLALLGASPG
jgi:hypothetical protein